MQAVIDSISGDFFRCLVENGDVLTVHKDMLPHEIEVGDVLKIGFEKDEKASSRQKELMK